MKNNELKCPECNKAHCDHCHCISCKPMKTKHSPIHMAGTHLFNSHDMTSECPDECQKEVTTSMSLPKQEDWDKILWDIEHAKAGGNRIKIIQDLLSTQRKEIAEEILSMLIEKDGEAGWSRAFNKRLVEKIKNKYGLNK